MARLRYWSMYISEIQTSEFGVITLFSNLWFMWFLNLVRWLFACHLRLILPSTEKVHFAGNSARGRCVSCCPWN